jgi:hypothetical protein
VKDWYQEERYAFVSATIRDDVLKMQAEGEHTPVVLNITSTGKGHAEILKHFRVYDMPEDLCVSYVIPEAVAGFLIDQYISPGLGSKITSIPAVPPEAFRFIVLSPGQVGIIQLVIVGMKIERASITTIDLNSRRLHFSDGEGETTIAIDW